MRWIEFSGLQGLVTCSLAKQVSLRMYVQASYLSRTLKGEGTLDKENGY